MDGDSDLGQALGKTMSTVVERVIDYLPNLFGAIALLIVGWALARVLRALTMRAVLILDKTFSRFVGHGAERLRVGSASVVMGTIVFWIVLLSFVTVATHVLGLSLFTDWLAQFVAYLPVLVAGVLIMIVGFVVSRIVADLVRATTTGITPAQRGALARVAQVTIVVGAVLVGADQIGVEVTFLVVFVAAIAAAIVGGVALSVGLGARDYVANLIGAHYIRQAVPVGQVVRIGEFEGRVIDVTVTAVILETANGRVSMPGRVFNEQPITVLTGNAGTEQQNG